VTFVKLNTDENPSIAGEYGISGIPCLILYKGGKAVDRIVGFVPENTIKQMLDKHLAAA
jgi:thioredoxin 1